MNDLKLTFVRQSLENYMSEVVEAMRREIIRRGIRVTDELLLSLAYNVSQTEAHGTAALSFAEWGRFIDMGVGRGHPLGGISATRDALNSKRDKGGIRKPKKFYSKIAYGKLNGLMADLMYGFTDEVKDQITQQLANAGTLNSQTTV